MKLLFCGYRDWAVDAFNRVHSSKYGKKCQMQLVTNNDDLTRILDGDELSAGDVVFLAGWSWIVQKKFVEKYFIVGMHPSDLPAYAGGSPIQHQVIDGIEMSRATLFRLTPKLDGGPIMLKTSLDLRGHMRDIFKSLTNATSELLERFIDEHPDIIAMPQLVTHQSRKRLMPKDSRLTHDDATSMTTKQLYDFIRCREDPYPNVFLEDETGKLMFKSVEFVPSSNEIDCTKNSPKKMKLSTKLNIANELSNDEYKERRRAARNLERRLSRHDRE